MFVEPEGETLRHENIDLKRGDADGCGGHFADDFAHGFIAPGRDPLETKALAVKPRKLKSRLSDSSNDYTDGQRKDLFVQRFAHARREKPHAGNHDDIERRSAERGDEKMVAGVCHPNER